MTITPSITPFAAALLASKASLRVLKGTMVLYCTDDFEIEVLARVGKTTFITDTDRQLNTRVRTRDFLIETNQLRHPETLAIFEPTTGHRIKQIMINGTWQTYEVLPVGDEPAFREGDTTASEWRIHTKRVANSEESEA